MNIEIGGGTLAQPGWVNLDPKHGEGLWRREAQVIPWPTGDNSVDAIRASHVMEHIPSGQPRIDVMNEAHRVLAPSAVFEIIVPVVRTDGRHPTWESFADPTHVSLWCWESFHYFDGTFFANADYGVKQWDTVSQEWTGNAIVTWRGTPR
jgi:SAM-dependent methyltransferase